MIGQFVVGKTPPGTISERMIGLLPFLSKIQSDSAWLECLFIFTNDEPERHHPRGVSLRSHDLPVPGRERHRQHPSPSPFLWSATSSRWDHSGALLYPQRRGLRH